LTTQRVALRRQAIIIEKQALKFGYAGLSAKKFFCDI